MSTIVVRRWAEFQSLSLCVSHSRRLISTETGCVRHIKTLGSSVRRCANMVACSSAVWGRYRIFRGAACATWHSSTNRNIRPESCLVDRPVPSGANRRFTGYLCLSHAGETLTSSSPWQHNSSPPLGGADWNRWNSRWDRCQRCRYPPLPLLLALQSTSTGLGGLVEECGRYSFTTEMIISIRHAQSSPLTVARGLMAQLSLNLMNTHNLFTFIPRTPEQI